MKIEVERLYSARVDREGGIALTENIAVACPYEVPGISLCFDGSGIVLSREEALKLGQALLDHARDA